MSPTPPKKQNVVGKWSSTSKTPFGKKTKMAVEGSELNLGEILIETPAGKVIHNVDFRGRPI